MATKNIAKQIQNNELNVEDINEKLFEDQLQVKTLDCVVRTSGERRLSGFLPWQSRLIWILNVFFLLFFLQGDPKN